MRKKIKRLAFLALYWAMATSLLAQERFRKSPPVPEPLFQLKLPAVESVRHRNGLTVAVVNRSSSRLMDVELIVQAGEVHSPEGLPGLAAFTAEMLSRGTITLSASDMEERIESIGGSLTVTTSLDLACFSFQFLDDYFEQALEILSQMVLQPAFSSKEITTLKRIRYYDILERQRDPDFVGRRHLKRLLVGDHPYRNGFYNEDTIRNISRKDIVTFYEKYYRPNNAVIILTGKLNLATASRRVSHFFNTWQEAEIERVSVPALKPNGEARVCLVDLPAAKEATLIVGNVIFPVGDPDFFSFSVLNQVLGGAASSRLFMNLRESKGYAYFAFSRAEFYRYGGVYTVEAKVVPSACYNATQEILKELEKLVQERIPTFEIEQAKSRLIGNFPLQVERHSNLADRVSEMVTFSLSSAYWERFYDNIMLVDAERVHEVARRYLQPPPIVVIIGDKNRLAEFLDRFERVEVFDVRGNLQYIIHKEGEK